MADIEGEIVINGPAEVVFDTVADERNEPRYNARVRNVEKVTAGPIGTGTKFRAQTVRMGRAAKMIIVYTEFDRPRQLASATHMSSMDFHGIFTFDPVPEGTRMRWSWNVQPRGLLSLIRPLILRVGRRQEHTIWSALKRHIEQQPRPAASDQSQPL
jgi:hypothetical protein